MSGSIDDDRLSVLRRRTTETPAWPTGRPLRARTEPDGSLRKPALEALGGAQLARSGALVAALGETRPGRGPARPAPARRASLAVAGDDFAQPRYATDAAAAEALARAAGATLVVAPGTSRWPRVAGRRGPARWAGAVDTHVTARGRRGRRAAPSRAGSTGSAWRPALPRAERPWVLALDPGCHAPREPAGGGRRRSRRCRWRWRSSARRTQVTGVARARRRRADHPARRRPAVRGRRRAGRRSRPTGSRTPTRPRSSSSASCARARPRSAAASRWST